MAASIIAAPGTEYGPCQPEDNCKHKDCAQTYLMADSLCPYCHKPIGYGRRFYQMDGKILTHASCYEYAIEKERSKNA